MSEKKKNKGTIILIVVLVLALVGFVGYKAYGTLNQPTEEEAANDWEEIPVEGKKDADGINTAATAALYTACSNIGLKVQVPDAYTIYVCLTSPDSTVGPNYFDVSSVRTNKLLGIIEMTLTSTADSDKYVVYRVCKNAKTDCSGDSREVNGTVEGISCYYDEQGIVRKLIWNWSLYSYSIVISDAVKDGDNPFNDGFNYGMFTTMLFDL